MNVPPKYVVDASVVVKWFSKFEEDAESSERLLNSHIEGASVLASPSLVLYEVCNALRFNPNFGQEDIAKAAISLVKLELELVDFPEIFESAVGLAFSQDITIYDAAYIAVSRTQYIPLITADDKLMAKVRDLPLVMALGEMKL
ncbi:MAG: PIN domain-containing protein [Dehalococcoidia bacterium]|nr:MAG: PIN domain-containing protein [Dehalococcoidia bacterium]